MNLRLIGLAVCGVIAQACARADSSPPPPSLPPTFACKPLACSSLIPARTVDDPSTNDCAYRAGNEWWVDAVAGSLLWDGPKSQSPSSRESASSNAPIAAATPPQRKPVIVALFDDGVAIDHPDLQHQLWTNPAEAAGQPGVDDDHNGYVDDLHGWDFVDDDANVAPEGECVGRASHGTLMASLIAAERNNGIGIAAPGSDGARVMILRIAGCGGKAKDQLNAARIVRALEYATRMGARILSFSAHWPRSDPALDAAFARVADTSSTEAAILVTAVPNKGELRLGYPAAYSFRRIVRAVPIGNDNIISPGTSAAPPGLNLGAPSACVLGASAGPQGFAIAQGSSNSAAILSGLLAGLWSSEPYAKLDTDEFLAQVLWNRMLQTPRRSQPDVLGRYPNGVPLADACTLASKEKTARVCLEPGQPRGLSK